MKNLINKFIKENNLDLTETGSALNSACCILSGYALYIGIEHVTDLTEIVINSTNSDSCNELERVFDYAQYNNYAKWWESEEAKKQFKF